MRRRRGFTLIELMVAMTIFSFLLAAVYFTFRTAQRCVSEADRQSDSNQETRAVLEQLTHDLANLYPLKLTQTETSSEQTGPASPEEGLSPNQLAFNHEDDTDASNDLDLDSLSFVSAATDPAAAQTVCSDLAEITYYVDQDDSTPEEGLVRTVNRLPGLAADPVQPSVTELCPEVVSLNFRFWDDQSGDWVDTWDTPDTLPPLLEVTLGIVRRAGEETEQPTVVQTIIEPRSQGLPAGFLEQQQNEAAAGQQPAGASSQSSSPGQPASPTALQSPSASSTPAATGPRLSGGP